MNRIQSLDFLRGIAVIVMLLANTAPYLLDLEQNYTCRLIFSIAAPIFIFLSGYTLELKYKFNKLNIINFKRPIQILILGIIVDVLIWRIYPFLTFDVLYLISISQILILLINCLENSLVIKLIFLVLFFFLPVFYHIDYRFVITEPEVGSYMNLTELIHYNPLKRFLFDGWFPLFPWFCIALLGSLFRFFENHFKFWTNTIILFVSIFFIVFSIISSNACTPVPRVQYLELWYPLNGTIIYFVLGIVGISIFLLKSKLINMINQSVFNLFIILGRNSLFIYIFHTFIISIFLLFYNNNINNSALNIILFCIIILVVVILTRFLDLFKGSKRWSSFPKIVKYILGL